MRETKCKLFAWGKSLFTEGERTGNLFFCFFLNKPTSVSTLSVGLRELYVGEL